MIVRHGMVIAEGWWKPYAPELPHTLFSLSKSFASSAIGLAVSEGLLSEDDHVISFFPDDLPAEVSLNLAQMRVRDLLTMRSGHAEDVLGSWTWQSPNQNWMRTILEQPVPYQPGTHFVYNSGATFMLSAIIQNVTGQHLLTYLEPRLLEPLGIQGATWETNPEGIAFGGYGMNARTEDIAKFGLLYLHQGAWQGKRILSEAWCARATSALVPEGAEPDSDWARGYGYQFWRCRHGAYRGDGAFGQFCVVMPEQDAVVAMTGGMANMQAGLNLVWDHLLPNMHSIQLEPNDADQHELIRVLANLKMPMVQHRAEPDVVFEREFEFTENATGIESISFSSMANGVRLRIRDARGTHSLECGFGAWLTNETRFDDVTTFSHDQPRQVAGSAGWLASDVLEVKLCYFETAFSYTMRVEFAGDGVRVYSRANVGFGNPVRDALEGQLKR